ncbi:group II intron reverse transcriptase/maturase (plasmid) [Streptomyces sp. NBC_01591]|uniref:group II intron reverse transcriptase/maturase n=1 Tax=Streptomyces sp. NBC_01591 TaxID=2975888 RepID=UPI002DDA0C09|nr:group II intron reverse transcriptase/maturase [Streptomyces sp. NBC_01591]WSD74347.1 group II intron reverse transcriptase/maturase [Streptomyces sp. NBC_01591]
MNSSAPSWPNVYEAERRVLDHQRKLHRWARADPERRFGDVINLICDRATLLVAWERVAGNKGARTAGVDAVTRRHVEEDVGVLPFLEELRSALRDGTFTALPVRQGSIPKRNGKIRLLGIPTLRDRVAQMALKLVLEPVFEVDFYPSSYGYRPGRRAQDAIAEIHQLTSRSYEWVVEGDITACFDNVDHQVLMGLVEERVSDRKVLRLVRAFLRAGIVKRHGGLAASLTGTPQGGVASPLLANIYLSVLDRHFAGIWEREMSPPWRRQQRRRRGQPNYRLIRYADDFVVLVHGERSDAEAIRAEIAQMLAERLKMTLSVEKTHITHIDDGFVFLGFRIQRWQRGDGRRVVLTIPSKDALARVMHKIKEATRASTTSLRIGQVLRMINPVLRGWAAYFRYGASKRTFSYLGWYAWWRMIYWIRRKHPHMTWKQTRRRFYGTDRICEDGLVLYNPAKMPVERYRFRGAQIATPYNIDEVDPSGARFRRIGHDDVAFVGQVLELVN